MEKKINLLKSQIRNIKFGKNCTIIEPSNLYECELGNDVFVGPFVEITNGVKVGDFTFQLIYKKTSLEIQNFEPKMALVASKNGYEFYYR